jgi:deoxyadenosine/deoxycytidine kinase
MLIIDGTIGSDVSIFLARLYEDTPPCTMMLYTEWIIAHDHHCHDHTIQHPEGIVYVRVSPEIAYTRIKKRALPSESDITLDYIQQIYQQKEELFIENKNNPLEIQHLPVLVLNGNIDFQTDFSQFYNHLFYIKRLLNQIQEKKDIALGIYKEKPTQRHCC